MYFLETSCFVGKYKIAKDCFTKSELEAYIDKYEERYLQDLLGCKLYDLFIADLNDDEPAKPQELRFRKIFEPFCVEDDCGVVYRSEGIKEMLLGFVYYHYVLDQKFKNTISGINVSETAFSREINSSKSTIEDRYNLAVETYVAIQMFMMDDKNCYPEFNGTKKRKSFFGGSF